MNKEKKLKVAILHDWAWAMRGGENVLEAFCEIFPDAEIFMIFGNKKNLSESIKSHKINYSLLSKIPFIKKFYRYSYFLWPFIVELWNFNDYDLVLSSSTAAMKGVITSFKTKHISYIHAPMRYAWDQSWDYFNPANFSLWKLIVIPFFLTFLRIWDYVSSARVDEYIANSQITKKRIEKYYRRKVYKIINPPVWIDRTWRTKDKEDYYVSIAPFEPNKGGRYMVETAIKYNLKLYLIGEGSLKKELEKMAKGNENIIFTGRCPEKEKYDLLAKSSGYLFCGIEDFGITVLEAIASGSPVIAYAAGGALETVKPGLTGELFYSQDPESLISAIKKTKTDLQKGIYSNERMYKFAEQFSKENFKKNIKETIEEIMSKE